MLEDLGAIQARISEIQDQIAALRPATPPATTDNDNAPATFNATLQRAQSAPGVSGGADARTPGASSATETVSGIRVPAASLGPLPPMPVSPGLPSAAPVSTGTGTGQYAALIQAYAAKHGIDPKLVRAVIQTESGGNPRAVSPAGAMGLMQLMPANIQEAGISDAFDPEQNIAAGTQQLSGLLKEYGGDLDLALAGYNAGPGNVRRYGGVPPFRETQNYIRKVRAAMGDGG